MTWLLLLALVFLVVTYYCARNWFVYETMYAGMQGHAQVDGDMGTLVRLQAQWYWAMVMNAVLTLVCLGLAVLRMVSKRGVEVELEPGVE
jgi:hypothetical protein